MNNDVSIPRVQSPDRTINQLQQNIIAGVQSLQRQINNGPNNGVFVTTQLKTGSNIVNHSLQAVPTGYIITDTDAASTIFREAFTKNTVTLNASAPVSITFYLF